MLTLDELKKLCEDSHILELCLPVLEHPLFLTCPFNLEESLPHSRVGGLINHTYEIISSGILLCSLYKTYKGVPLNIKEYIVSAMWCNYGKLSDYICLDEEVHTWKVSDTHSKIPTVYKSAAKFESYVSSLTNCSDVETEHNISFNNIIHNIVSLSTEQPQTAEAHILLSATKLVDSLHPYTPTT